MAQRAQQQGRARHAIGVVVAADGNFFAAGNGAFEPRHARRQPLESRVGRRQHHPLRIEVGERCLGSVNPALDQHLR
ncbi:MAG: hypothetical protein BRC58_06315 [Cyanobacteria bacterium QS_8_64_29]|nr:MAG: hypothetical protein BRC58_06315 [Cyanobacteria bacterium QS_8_64_29]